MGLKIFIDFDYFHQKPHFTLFFRNFTWISKILGQLIHMTCILSTPWVVETGFWTLSSLYLDLFRATFVFTYFFLCGISGLMRDQSSQFVPNSDLHVVGEIKICFQTIILKGVVMSHGDINGSEGHIISSLRLIRSFSHNWLVKHKVKFIFQY